MRRMRPLLGAMAIAAAGMLGTYPLPVHAQSTQAAPRITQSIQTVEAPISAQDLQVIDSFNRYWVDQLASGDKASITKARQTLRSAMSPAGSSEEYLKQFNKNLLQKIQVAIQAPKIPANATKDERESIAKNLMLTRINTMIVLVNTQGEGVEAALAVGLSDSNGGVRYWASKAIAKIAEYKRITKEEQPKILKLLEKSLGKETQAAALSEQLAALSNMNVGSAREILLNVLSARVGVHAKDVLASYTPEQKALQDMFFKLISDTERNGIDPVQIKTFTRVAFRYAKLATDQLIENENLTPEIIADKRAMIRLTDDIFRFAHEKIDPGARQPEKIDNALTLSKWDFIRIKIDQWHGIFTKSPFNIDAKELE
ncbi:hypothetical protein JD969_09070 [Planctomycetota bacterium]|nr:hypothetical protein JD969_09070 [Planctomycetota bacterium]